MKQLKVCAAMWMLVCPVWAASPHSSVDWRVVWNQENLPNTGEYRERGNGTPEKAFAVV